MDPMDRLIAAVDASGLKQKYIADKADMLPSTLTKILKRQQIPSLPQFIAIAQAIRHDPARLFTENEMAVQLELLRAAHTASQRVTDLLASMLPEAPGASAPTIPPADAPISQQKGAQTRSVLPVQAAANPNAVLLVELESKRQRIPRGAWNRKARIIARAVGDSMDGGPDPIRNGELVYLRPTRSPRTANNHIVLIRRDDGLYLKLFEMTGSRVKLVSMNGADPIEFDVRGENVQIYGYVVDHERAPA